MCSKRWERVRARQRIYKLGSACDSMFLGALSDRHEYRSQWGPLSFKRTLHGTFYRLQLFKLLACKDCNIALNLCPEFVNTVASARAPRHVTHWTYSSFPGMVALVMCCAWTCIAQKLCPVLSKSGHYVQSPIVISFYLVFSGPETEFS